MCADISAARELISHLRDEGLSFDAVVVSDDELAVGAVKYAHAAGISIPDELSVIGYNNSLLSRCTDPELSSIDNKVEDPNVEKRAQKILDAAATAAAAGM